MCTLTDKVDVKVVKGFKVVAIRGDKYLSPATGFEYASPGKWTRLKMITEQNRLTWRFSDKFLDPLRVLAAEFAAASKKLKLSKKVKERLIHDEWMGVRVNMIGRSAVFESLESAQRLRIACEDTSLFSDVHFTIFEAEVKGDLLKGTYDWKPVHAGRYLRLGKEVEVA